MTQRRKPRGVKGMRRKLEKQKALTGAEVRKAMLAASQAIDQLNAELTALRQVLVMERAQVIYYTDMAVGYSRRDIVDVVLVPFMQLPEEKRQEYVKKAVVELTGPAPAAPQPVVKLTDGPESVQ